MADIELVIRISEEDYESIKDDVKKFLSMPSHKVPVLYEAVNNGTLLPKGHGDLIDAGVLCDYFWDNRSRLYTRKDLQIVIDNAPIIIEANTEEKEEREDRE